MYKPTELEYWISQTYIRKGVMEPGDLSRKKIEIAFGFDYYLMYSPSFCVAEESTPYMIIDNREPIFQQREEFFHELGHILLHTPGKLTKAFRDLLEGQARNFVKYAAIPYHMLKFIDFWDDNYLYEMSETFKVSLDLCCERSRQIKNHIIEGR